jgi:hypothetical protein
MSSVCVPATLVERGVLPPVCPLHGLPATELKARTFYTRTPAWVLVLCLVSLLVPVLVALALRSSIEGQVPACESCAGARVVFLQRSIALWAATGVALTFALALGNAPLLLLGLALTAGALVFTFAGDTSIVAGELDKRRYVVRFRGVASPFVQAVAEDLAATGRPATSPVTILPRR